MGSNSPKKPKKGRGYAIPSQFVENERC